MAGNPNNATGLLQPTCKNLLSQSTPDERLLQPTNRSCTGITACKQDLSTSYAVFIYLLPVACGNGLVARGSGPVARGRGVTAA